MATPLPLSTVDASVEIDLALARDLLEREVPQVLEHEKTWERSGNTGLRYRIERGPVEVAFVDGELVVRAQLRYRAQACAGFGNVCQPIASCGYGKDGMRRVELELRSPLSLSPTWELQLDIRASHRFVDPCEVTFLHVDVSDQLDHLLRAKLQTLLPKLERKLVEAANVRARAARAWTRMQEPIRLRDGIWLVLSPRAAHVSPPAGHGDIVRFVVGVEGQPSIVAGVRPNVALLDLPPLAAGARPAGAALFVQAAVPYDEATRQLRDLVIGRTLQAGGQRLVVRDLALGGSAQGAAVKLEVESDKGLFRRLRGTVYVVGKPVWDPASGVLSLENLDYSLESQDLPLRMAESLLRPELLGLLQRKARWPLGGRIDQARALATRALHRELAPGVFLSGSLDRLEPIEVVAERDRFVASVAAYGNVSIVVGREAAEATADRQRAAAHP